MTNASATDAFVTGRGADGKGLSSEGLNLPPQHRRDGDGTGRAVDGVRERILDAALAEFSAYGLRRTGMESVAKRAGVARATVYRRFADKDDLVRAVILRESRRFMAAFHEVVRPYPRIADQITEGWVFAVAHLRRHPLFSGLLMVDAEAILPYLTVQNGAVLAAARDFLVPFIRAGQERGEVPGVAPEQVAELMVRIVMSYVISRDGCLDLTDETALRAFARSHLVPAVCCAKGDGQVPTDLSSG